MPSNAQSEAGWPEADVDGWSMLAF
jgi:hypothetical protein